LAIRPIVALLVFLALLKWRAPEAGPMVMFTAAIVALLAFRTPWDTSAVAGAKGVWDAIWRVHRIHARRVRRPEALGTISSLGWRESANVYRRTIMSNLVVFDFDGIHTADEVLNKLRSLQKEYLIDLEDACVVERDQGGKVHIKQAVNLTTLGATTGMLRGALFGTLVGLIFLNPLAGMAVGVITGAGVGALSGSLADFGIRDDFIKELSKTIPSGSSALFVLFRSITEDRVLPEIEPYKPRVLKTSLSNEQETKLRATLSKAA
jgi:uncharacterized membrane protein